MTSFKHGSVSLDSWDKLTIYTPLYCSVSVGFNSNGICGSSICCSTDRAKLGAMQVLSLSVSAVAINCAVLPELNHTAQNLIEVTLDEIIA